MKTNLNNIWHKCSWRNLQQTYVEQMSDLFVEHRYFEFQNEIHFFHITTMEHQNFSIQKAFLVAIGLQIAFPSLASYHLHDRSYLMSWCNIIFTFLSNLLSRCAPKARCLVTDDAFTGFSDNDRRRCRSVAQTSALLSGNEWTSLWTFAVTVRLELI